MRLQDISPLFNPVTQLIFLLLIPFSFHWGPKAVTLSDRQNKADSLPNSEPSSDGASIF